MPRRRKLLILAGAFVVVVVTLALWLRPKGYVYQGKTVKRSDHGGALVARLCQSY